jgi:hypothetical protein
MRKPLANALDSDLRGGLTEPVTPPAGVARLRETARRRGVLAAAARALPATPSPTGLRQGEMVEALVRVSAPGGECSDDLTGCAATRAWRRSPATRCRRPPPRGRGRTAAMTRPCWPTGRGRAASFRRRRRGVAGRRAAGAHRSHASVTAVQPARAVTRDGDAHSVESRTREAVPTSTGERGCQPLLVRWAETGMVLADQLGDGNVPASTTSKAVVARAAATLPYRPAGWAIRVRSDRAAAAQASRDHWAAQGWPFAVRAAMSAPVRAAVVAVPAAAGPPWAAERGARSAATGYGHGRRWPPSPAGRRRARTRRPLGTWRCGGGRGRAGGSAMARR